MEIDYEGLNMQKYKVTRNDGSSCRGKKHEDCQYFVLDINHDPHAASALETYAASCAVDFPELSKDLWRLAARNRLLTGK